MVFLLLAACAFRAPVEPPALVAAEGPVATVPLPAGSALRVGVRAGSAHDPPGREGLAWVTAHAIADAVGAAVEVGPEVVVFTVPVESAGRLAAALVTPPAADRVGAATAAALQALDDLDCRALAERAWDAWIYAGHPYGHAPEGRRSVLPTLSRAEVAGFQSIRYVTSAVVVGLPSGVSVDPAFSLLPPLLSASPVPATRMPLPAARVLTVTDGTGRCLVAGHPAEPPADATARLVDTRLAGPEAGLSGVRRQARRLVYLPLPPERNLASYATEVLAGGWVPLWRASNVLAASPLPDPAAAALTANLLARAPWPSLAPPTPGGLPGVTAADVATPAVAPPAADAVDAALAGWLTPAETRLVVVLPPGEQLPIDGLARESDGAPVVQAVLSAQELLR